MVKNTGKQKWRGTTYAEKRNEASCGLLCSVPQAVRNVQASYVYCHIVALQLSEDGHSTCFLINAHGAAKTEKHIDRKRAELDRSVYGKVVSVLIAQKCGIVGGHTEQLLHRDGQ